MIRLEEFLIDGRVDIALLSELSRLAELVLSTALGREEMVLLTRPGPRGDGRAARRARHNDSAWQLQVPDRDERLLAIRENDSRRMLRGRDRLDGSSGAFDRRIGFR